MRVIYTAKFSALGNNPLSYLACRAACAGLRDLACLWVGLPPVQHCTAAPRCAARCAARFVAAVAPLPQRTRAARAAVQPVGGEEWGNEKGRITSPGINYS